MRGIYFSLPVHLKDELLPTPIASRYFEEPEGKTWYDLKEEHETLSTGFFGLALILSLSIVFFIKEFIAIEVPALSFVGTVLLMVIQWTIILTIGYIFFGYFFSFLMKGADWIKNKFL